MCKKKRPYCTKEVEMKKARNSSVLKVLCYILIPILVAILGLSLFHMAFLSEFEATEGQMEYSQTEVFANNYLYFFINKIVKCENMEQSDDTAEQLYDFVEVEDSQGNRYYYSDHLSSYHYRNGNGIGAYINYVIVNRETRQNVYQYKE